MGDSTHDSRDRRRYSDRKGNNNRGENPSRSDQKRYLSRSPDENSRDRRDRDFSHRGHSENRNRDSQHHRDRREDRDRTSTRNRSRSPRTERSQRKRSLVRRSRSRSPRGAVVRSRGPLLSQKDAFVSADGTKTASPAPEKEKPNFWNTGRLAAESNTVHVKGGTVVLKYHEPPEARKPPAKDDWRLYVFKGSELLEVVPLGERSCWLIGREERVVDFPIEHPSCSKQHAAIQFRYVEKKNEFGDRQGRVRPYLIDLESSNGSMVNSDRIPASCYVELRDKDVLKFGLSSREYVLMLPPPE